MVLRRRKPAIGKFVRDLDVFVKVEEHCSEQTVCGALVYFLTLFCVVALLWSECVVYCFNPSYKFKFTPDGELLGSLNFNLDITVAMPCGVLGADNLDSTDQEQDSYDELKLEPASFELDDAQRQRFERARALNEYLREEYHAIQDWLWTRTDESSSSTLPPSSSMPSPPSTSLALQNQSRRERILVLDGNEAGACRIHGSVSLNKVKGNFHITLGEAVSIDGNHFHLAGLLIGSLIQSNFSHRIDQFSFGHHHPGIIQPLEGDEKIATKDLMRYQYLIEIVPTEVRTLTGTWKTYQYSVKEHARQSLTSGQGIFFKYDFFPLKLTVSQDREAFWRFLVRLCSGIGGIFSTSHLVAGLLHCFFSATSRLVKKTMTVPLPSSGGGSNSSS